jgi:intracellular multiplication protein IcmO
MVDFRAEFLVCTLFEPDLSAYVSNPRVSLILAYQGSDDGGYREAREAAVRAVSRVDRQDLVSLLEGEAIFLMGGRRIYGRVFYAPIDDRGIKRLGRTITLRGPDPGAVRSRLGGIDGIAAAVMKGSLTVGQDEQMTAVLAALLRGWDQATRAGLDAASCARAALEAVGRVLGDQTERSAPPEGVPVTSVSPMIEAATAARYGGEASDKPPRPPVDAALLRGLQKVEQAGGIPVVAAREIPCRSCPSAAMRWRGWRGSSRRRSRTRPSRAGCWS